MHSGPPRFLPVAVVGETEESEVPRGERASGGEKPRGAGRIEIRCKGGRDLKVEADLARAVLRPLTRSVEEA